MCSVRTMTLCRICKHQSDWERRKLENLLGCGIGTVPIAWKAISNVDALNRKLQHDLEPHSAHFEKIHWSVESGDHSGVKVNTQPMVGCQTLSWKQSLWLNRI